ncbi:MAG: CPBP family intramembrane metalloprotease, partial [Robiginitomaculum sp.]|nr:CPBP family intramembrane metalloprotease [Robiginitomaculum sp.]
METLWWVEILLSLLTLFITIKYFSWQEVGVVKLETKQLLWLMPLLLPLTVMWGGIFNFLYTNPMTPEHIKLFALVGFTTLLVGFSEELMYRGVVFSAFWQNKEVNRIKAVLIRALVFSLLHSAHIFAGTTLGAT